MIKNTQQTGQALITLIIFVAISITITSALVIVSIVNSQSLTALGQGQNALNNAKAGAEDAIIKLLRDPTFKGETITTSDGSATVSVSGSSTLTITSTGMVGNAIKTFQVIAIYSNNSLTINSWKEIQ